MVTTRHAIQVVTASGGSTVFGIQADCLEEAAMQVALLLMSRHELAVYISDVTVLDRVTNLGRIVMADGQLIEGSEFRYS